MLSPATARRLQLLIPVLGSDCDGEALGAARAIDRILRADGADLHILARAIAAPRNARARVMGIVLGWDGDGSVNRRPTVTPA